MEGSKTRPERTSTDEKLETERTRTDTELLARSQAIGEDADAVLNRARERASAVLALARARADATAPPADPARIQAERDAEDVILTAEHDAADDVLHVEREQRRLALRQLLALERAATDRTLAVERAIADRREVGRDALATVAHDMRGMLQAVSFNAATIVLGVDRDVPPAKIVSLANSIQRVAAQMEQLLGDLQELAAIEAGQARSALQRCDLCELVRTAVEIHIPAATVNELVLEVALPPDPIFARVDANRISRVLLNLLGNAIKFTPNGGRIHVQLARVENEIELEVADSGPGIEADQLEAIFEKFHQTTVARGRGFGLGLYIARSIVTAHGGRIWAESTPGHGATFRVRLPAA